MATREQIPTLAGELVKHQSGFKALSTKDAQTAILDMPAFLKCACEAWTNRNTQVQKSEEYLKLISGGEALLLDSTDGAQFIGLSDAIFNGGIDVDLYLGSQH